MVSTEGKLRAPGPGTALHPAVRFGARILSYLFHPLFIPLYLAYYKRKNAVFLRVEMYGIYKTQAFGNYSDHQGEESIIDEELYQNEFFFPIRSFGENTDLINKKQGEI